jgi:toxin-antitoxin system PIN domain toxin
LEEVLSGSSPVLFPWLTLLAFLRLSTSRSSFSDPYSVGEACAYVDDWLATPPARVVEPGAGHLSRVQAMLTKVGSGGNLVNDAHLAAIAIERGMPIVSFDNDFDRFEGVKRLQPGAR